MRLFVGLPVPDPTAKELTRRTGTVLAEWDRARRMEAEDLHVTLRFLGEMEADRVPGIEEAMVGARGEAIELRLGGVGVFRGAGAVYASVNASVQLTDLHEALSEALAWHGVARELREFHPHVTLARRRHGLPQNVLERWTAVWEPMEVRVDSLVLYRSVGGGGGAGNRYEWMREVRLGGF